MFSSVRRFFSGLTKRSLDAGGHGRRFDAAKRIDNLNSDLFATTSTIRARAAHLARNNPWVASGINSLVSNLVGTGIVPQPKHPDPATAAALRELFETWTDEASLDERLDFYGFQALATRIMLESGECFFRLRTTDPARSISGVPLRLDLIRTEQVPLDHHVNLENGNIIRAGVEFSPDGERVAYWVYPQLASDPWGTQISVNPVRIDASEIVHLFEPLVAGQVRGLSRIAIVLLRSLNLDLFEDAALERAKVAALMCGFIRDPDGSAAGLSAVGMQAGGALDLSMEPGSLIPLPPGADITLSDPKTADQSFQPFLKHSLRSVAAGIGCTYEQLTGDYEGVTYSSVRASLVEFRRQAEMTQHAVLVHQLCRPVFARFVTLAAMLDTVTLTLSAAAMTATWLAPKWQTVDPSKDVGAEIQEIEAGLKSRSMAAQERGLTIEQLDAAIAADKAREKTLGLAFAADTVKPAPAPAMQEAAP